MRHQTSRIVAQMTMSFIACIQLPAYANAADMPALQNETPMPDARVSMEPADKQVPKVLTGSVERRGAAQQSGSSEAQSDAEQTAPTSDDRPEDAVKLVGEAASTQDRPAYLLALKKLAAEEQLTSQDFRSLRIGVLGMASVRPFFQDKSVVTQLYAGLPAEQAGVKLGDKWIDPDATKDDARVSDPTRPTWAFSCGIAGQPVDKRLVRHGRNVDVRLIRMNIEDVPDRKLREVYEQLVQSTGAEQAKKALGNAETPPSSAALATVWKTMLDFSPASDDQ